MRLSQAITQYVALKRSLGINFTTTEGRLKFFCRRVGDGDIKEITKEQVDGFLTTSSPINRYWYAKYEALRGFYKYAISRGYVQISPLPTKIPQLPPPFVPYIYTPQELRRLLDAIDSYRKTT